MYEKKEPHTYAIHATKIYLPIHAYFFLLLPRSCIAQVSYINNSKHFNSKTLKLPWVGLQCVSVVFPDHTHLLLEDTWSDKTLVFNSHNPMTKTN